MAVAGGHGHKGAWQGMTSVPSRHKKTDRNLSVVCHVGQSALTALDVEDTLTAQGDTPGIVPPTEFEAEAVGILFGDPVLRDVDAHVAQLLRQKHFLRVGCKKDGQGVEAIRATHDKAAGNLHSGLDQAA